jgi:transposase-like protein
MHTKAREGKNPGFGGTNKVIVAGVLERGGQVHAQIVENVRKETLVPFIYENVEKSSTVYTDSLRAYRGIRADFDHGVVDHHIGQYVNGIIYTNGIENFWSLLKRGIKGTYVSVAVDHLHRYIDERAFAFNFRKDSDYARFSTVLTQIAGRRVTYTELTGKN